MDGITDYSRARTVWIWKVVKNYSPSWGSLNIGCHTRLGVQNDTVMQAMYKMSPAMGVEGAPPP